MHDEGKNGSILGIKQKTKNTTLSGQFKNPVVKSQREAKSIP